MIDQVTSDAVDPFFGSALCIHLILYIAALAQDVTADEFGKQFALAERISQLGIPEQFVDVHVVVLKTTIGIHGDVCGGLQLEGEGVDAIPAILNFEDVLCSLQRVKELETQE